MRERPGRKQKNRKGNKSETENTKADIHIYKFQVMAISQDHQNLRKLKEINTNTCQLTIS